MSKKNKNKLKKLDNKEIFDEDVEEQEIKKTKKIKRKMTALERNRIIMRIAAWFFVLIMMVGVIMTFLIYFT